MEERSLVRQLLDPEPDEGPSPGERRGFSQVPWGWRELLVIGVFSAAVNLAFYPFSVGGFGMGPTRLSIAFFVQVIASYALILGAIWLVALRRHRAPWAVLGFRPVDLRGLAGLLGLLAIVIVAANLAVRSVIDLPSPPDLFIFGHGPRELAIMGVLVILAAPLAEETFFRGFLLQGLAQRLRFWPAAVVTSGIFAIAHIWWQYYLPIFILGLALSWLFWRTGSLWAPIAAHATINATSFVIVVILYR